MVTRHAREETSTGASQRAFLRGSSTAPLGDRLKPLTEIAASWVSGPSATQRAQFLVQLPHELTIAGRMLASALHPAEVRVERLWELNELQHRVVGDASYALEPGEDKRFLLTRVRMNLRGAGAGMRPLSVTGT